MDKVVRRSFQQRILIALSFFILFVSTASHALVFNIAPKAGTTLPTVVTVGGTVTAYYTVSNNTISQRNNNYVKYLPPGVTQVTSGGDYGDTCGSPFNLAAKGRAGDSCTLQLTVASPVSSSDPNPDNHLFVCFPGGITCAGTPYPLNVTAVTQVVLNSISISPASVTLQVGNTQAYTATGNYSDGSTQTLTTGLLWNSSVSSVASINATSGLVTADSVGTTNITATLGAVVSNPGTVAVVNPLLSIAITPAPTSSIIIGQTQQFIATGTYADSTTQVITNSVNWVSTNTGVATISSTGLATGVSLGETTITAALASVVSTGTTLSVVALAYVSNSVSTGSSISYCLVDPTTGALLACNFTGGNLNNPYGLVFNATGSTAYVTNTGNNTISSCPVNTNASLGSCSVISTTPFTGLRGIATNPANSYIYVTDATANIVYYCDVSVTPAICTSTGATSISSPQSLAFHPGGNRVYITNGNSTNGVVQCTANIDGTFSACFPVFGFGTANTVPGIAVNPNGNFLYFSAPGQNAIYACGILPSGGLQSCAFIPFTNPAGIAVNSTGTKIYITNTSSNARVCTLADNSITGCSNTGSGFSSPTGITIF